MGETLCPKCGALIETPGNKSAMGKGTISMRRAKRLSKNDLAILKLLINREVVKYPPTVREIQRFLINMEIPKKSKVGMIVKGWNYHDIQATLSRLVGAEVVILSNDPKVWLANSETMSWAMDKKPRYWVRNRKIAEGVITKNGSLEYTRREE